MATLVRTSVLMVSSPAFTANGYIPAKYTCEGSNINPPLKIDAVPPGTQSLVLIVDDPDAPNKTFDHWIVWNILNLREIPENTIPGAEGKNGSGKGGYKGPCPPTGIHHYHFKVYALNVLLTIVADSDKQAVEKAMEGHILAQGELVGLYKKAN